MSIKHFPRYIAWLVLLALVGGWVVDAVPARAQTCTPAAPATSCADLIQPGTVANTAPATLVIRGNGFVNAPAGPTVILDGYSALVTSYVDPTTLMAQLPADVPGEVNGRVYTLTVINGDGSQADPNTLALLVMTPAQPETPTPVLTPTPTNFVRPLIVISSYTPSVSLVTPGQTFDLEVNLINTGQLAANNVILTFFPGDFEPRTTGGVRSEGKIRPGETVTVVQTLTARSDLETGIGLLDLEVSYTDKFGSAYSDDLRIALDVFAPTQVSVGATATPTPDAANRPQLVIESYHTNVEMIRPGLTFTLDADVCNLGLAAARSVSMILGGGTSAGGASGTAEPGGVSGASGELGSFAPINSSNVQYLGDVPQGGTVHISQQLIANASIAPGAYSLKISFVYIDPAGTRYTDDQVITLLVHAPPLVNVSFYRPPDPLFVGQPGMLPIQVVNLGRESVVLGMMTASLPDAEMMNNTLLVGNLDPGFPITLDAAAIPSQPGIVDVTVTIEYTDHFNQPQTITQMLQVEVQEAMPMGPGMEGGGGGEETFEMPPAPETFLQTIWRFIRGMLGLDSARSTASGGSFAPGGEVEVVPVGPMKGP